MKNINEICHNDLTVVKHSEIYNYYKLLCEENRAKYPDVADYIARSYYYNILSQIFNLTPNYVCSIICKINNDELSFESDVIRAKLNIESDGEML